MHIDGKYIENRYMVLRGRKRMFEHASNQSEDEVHVDNEPMSEISKIEVHEELVCEFQKE